MLFGLSSTLIPSPYIIEGFCNGGHTLFLLIMLEQAFYLPDAYIEILSYDLSQ